MPKKVDRIIVDTNLWISFLIRKDFKNLDNKIRTDRVKLLFSVEAMDEFLTVVDRPYFRKYFSKDDTKELIELFEVYGEIAEVTSIVEACRDPKDNFWLSLSKDSNADYLITGDLDLLVLKRFERTKIITMTDYLRTISKRRS